MITIEEKKYLRELAKKLRDLAQDEKWRQREQDWIDLYNHKSRRTLIYSFVFDDAWLEILHPSKTLRVKDPMFRKIEFDIIKRIYRAEHFACDTVLYPDLYVPIEYRFSDWADNFVKPYGAAVEGELRTTAVYHPVLETTADLKKLRKPKLEYLDWKKTDENYEAVSDVFGELLPVHKGCPFIGSTDFRVFGWGLSIIDVLCELRGLEQVFYDIYEEPEFLHEVLSFMQEGYLDYIDTMEKEHLFVLNNNGYYHSLSGGEASPVGENGLGITDRLPGKDFDPQNVKAKDLWGYMQEQEFTAVGADARYEFAIKYQKAISERFGAVTYGCCENNDFNYDNITENISNLEVVSVPYVSDIRIAAERLKDYVMAWRPLQTPVSSFNEEEFRRKTMEHMEIMKDNNAVYWCGAPLTLEGHPEYIDKTTKIVRECAEYYARR